MCIRRIGKSFLLKKAKIGPLTPLKSISNIIFHNKVGYFINLQSFTFHLIPNMKMFKPNILAIIKQTKLYPGLGSTTPLTRTFTRHNQNLQ